MKWKREDYRPENLVAFRKALGLSQKELAERAGFQQSYVSRCEQPGSGLGNPAIEAFAKALGRNPEELCQELDRNEFPESVNQEVEIFEIKEMLKDFIRKQRDAVDRLYEEKKELYEEKRRLLEQNATLTRMLEAQLGKTKGDRRGLCVPRGSLLEGYTEVTQTITPAA